MPPINFWAGLLQGFAQGLEQQRKRKQDEEELKLKQDLAKRQLSLQDILEKRAQREAEQHEIGKSARASIKQGILGQVGPETMPQEAINPVFQERAAGDEPLTGEPFTNLRDALMGQRSKDVYQANLRAAMVDIAQPQDLPGLLGMRPRRANARQRLVGLPPNAEAALARQMGLSPQQYQAVTGRPYPC